MLLQVLERYPDEHCLFIDEAGKSINVGDVKDFCSRVNTENSIFRNKKVALLFNKDSVLCKHLVLLDGLCEQLVILASNLCDKELKRIVAESESDYLLTDFAEVEVELNCTVVNCKNVEEQTENAKEIKNSNSTTWILSTSGTTGTPKLVAHSLSTLVAKIANVNNKSLGHVWGMLYDISRFAGLQVFLQSIYSQSTLKLVNRNESLSEMIDELVAHQVNAISATPTLWRKILMLNGSKQLKLTQLTLGGEIADEAILKALRRTYTSARITHIFASTEAGACFSVTDGEQGFPVSYLETPYKGVELKIDANNHLLIRTPSVANGYLGNNNLDVNEDGFIDTGDCVAIEGDRVVFLGRESGTINVGGNKVLPEEIERVLVLNDKVKQVRAFGKKNPFTGQVVCAEVVLQDNWFPEEEKTFISELKRLCSERLASYKVPALIKIVDELPVSVSGKIKRV